MRKASYFISQSRYRYKRKQMFDMFTNHVCTCTMYVCCVCIICMYSMYVFYLCNPCMYSIYVFYVCILLLHSIYAFYVCILCMYSMYSMYVSNVFKRKASYFISQSRYRAFVEILKPKES